MLHRNMKLIKYQWQEVIYMWGKRKSIFVVSMLWLLFVASRHEDEQAKLKLQFLYTYTHTDFWLFF